MAEFVVRLRQTMVCECSVQAVDEADAKRKAEKGLFSDRSDMHVEKTSVLKVQTYDEWETGQTQTDPHG